MTPFLSGASQVSPLQAIYSKIRVDPCASVAYYGVLPYSIRPTGASPDFWLLASCAPFSFSARPLTPRLNQSLMSRRDFARPAQLTAPATGYSRILGANDRVRMGYIGLGN